MTVPAQHTAQVFVVLDQRPGEAKADGVALARNAAAFDEDRHGDTTQEVGVGERAGSDVIVAKTREILPTSLSLTRNKGCSCTAG